MPDNTERCLNCEQEIDPELCHCGEYVKGHGFFNNHTAVPMGCVCGYLKEEHNK